MFCDNFADKVFSWPRTAIEGKRQRFTLQTLQNIRVKERKCSDMETRFTVHMQSSVCVIECLLAIVSIWYISPSEREMKGDFNLAKFFGNGVDQLQLSFTEFIYRLKDSGKFYVAWHTWETRIHHNHWYFSSLHHPPAHEWIDCLAEMLDPGHGRLINASVSLLALARKSL